MMREWQINTLLKRAENNDKEAVAQLEDAIAKYRKAAQQKPSDVATAITRKANSIQNKLDVATGKATSWCWDGWGAIDLEKDDEKVAHLTEMQLQEIVTCIIDGGTCPLCFEEVAGNDKLCCDCLREVTEQHKLNCLCNL